MSEEKTVKIYNKGQCRFLVEKAENGRNPKYLEPGGTAEVEITAGNKLLKTYPKDLVDMGKIPKAKSVADIDKLVKEKDDKIVELIKKCEELEVKLAKAIDDAKKAGEPAKVEKKKEKKS
jgi:hypothetical protein